MAQAWLIFQNLITGCFFAEATCSMGIIVELGFLITHEDIDLIPLLSVDGPFLHMPQHQ
jgi:hypothetical protein